MRVELYDGNGNLIASTLTGDDLSTAAVETGYYQFTGLQAGNYQVKFIAPSYQFTTQDASANTQDALDSDANAAGFSQLVTLAAGESNQTIDAGIVLPAETASLGNHVWVRRMAAYLLVTGSVLLALQPNIGALVAIARSPLNPASIPERAGRPVSQSIFRHSSTS